MRATLDGANRALRKHLICFQVLKEVGVVDSGGQGLVYIYEGFLSALAGEYIASEEFEATPAVMSEMICRTPQVCSWSRCNGRYYLWLLYRNHGSLTPRSYLC